MNKKIRQLEDDIYDLKYFRKRIAKIENAVEEANHRTVKKVSNFPSLVRTPLSLLRVDFFSNIFDVLKGTEFLKARRGIESSYMKIDNKIREMQNEIQRLINEIGKCNSNIQALKYQKTKYINQTRGSKR